MDTVREEIMMTTVEDCPKSYRLLKTNSGFLENLKSFKDKDLCNLIYGKHYLR